MMDSIYLATHLHKKKSMSGTITPHINVSKVGDHSRG